MSNQLWVSLSILGDWCVSLRPVLDRYSGTAALSVTAYELGRLRQHVFEDGRLSSVDLALFDPFPEDDRQAILKELNDLLHRQSLARKAAREALLAAGREAALIRDQFLTAAQLEEIIDLGIWAHAYLAYPAEADRLIDFYLDLTTVARVRAYIDNRMHVHAAFRDAVFEAHRRLYASSRASNRQGTRTVGSSFEADLRCLELTRAADRDTIVQSYRRLAKQYHPDLGGDAERMLELNQAYARLAATWDS